MSTRNTNKTEIKKTDEKMDKDVIEFAKKYGMTYADAETAIHATARRNDVKEPSNYPRFSDDGMTVTVMDTDGNLHEIAVSESSDKTIFDTIASVRFNACVISYYDARIHRNEADELFKRTIKPFKGVLDTRREELLIAQHGGTVDGPQMTLEERRKAVTDAENEINDRTATHNAKMIDYDNAIDELASIVSTVYDTYKKFGASSTEYRHSLVRMLAMNGLQPTTELVNFLMVKPNTASPKRTLETGNLITDAKKRKFVTLTCDYLAHFYKTNYANFNTVVDKSTIAILEKYKNGFEKSFETEKTTK